MPLSDACRVPVSTFRVQLHAGFAFKDLAGEAAYLRSLGISDLYLSPIYTASPGSLHGYDVNDYRTVSPELGGEEAFQHLIVVLRGLGLGVLLDVVPNHMGIAGPRNAWWRDVLEGGEHSAYAAFFDIQWNVANERAQHRVLVPLLEDYYGKVLEEGKIRVVFEGGFSLRYREVSLPMSLLSYASILRPLTREEGLASADRAEALTLVDAFTNLPRPVAAENREAAAHRGGGIGKLKQRLATWVGSQPGVAQCLEKRLQEINGVSGNAGSFAALHALIEEQHYRLARWKAGTHEINYRRFFAIDSLVGLHMENPDVFRECHRLISRFVQEGAATGLRIDHIDGLRQPADYLNWLQALPRPDLGKPLYVAVEKILSAPNETLPTNWPVHGTTGYEFIPQLAAILVDPAAEERISATYRKFTGETDSYADAVYGKKRLILDEVFANAVANLGTELAEIMAEDRRWQDLTRPELVTAVREIMAMFPVYRTYRSNENVVSPAERAVLDATCARAISRNPRLDPQPFEFVRDVLAGVYPSADAAPDLRQRLLEWALTFQQYTGAVMAKSVEDTVYYTYCRLIALNEVGGNPGHFGASIEAFDTVNRKRLESNPHGLLTTSTHDTKLSEDVRARLYALSELADDWDRWLERWHALNSQHATTMDQGAAPDRVDEYRFYQVLLGVWPLDPIENDDEFRRRLREHFRKAVDEAKRHTSPLQPNERYLAACDRFVDRLTSPEHGGQFLVDFIPCAQRIARLGMINSLTQLILKCTVPGIPDFYQGNEIWDFSLVDPDNRRPVDFEQRHTIQAGLPRRSFADLLEHWRDGGIKMSVMQHLLQFRSAQPALFRFGLYEPVAGQGTFAEHVVAFVRSWGGRSVLVAVPRLASAMGHPPVKFTWEDTRLGMSGRKESQWRDIFTGRIYRGEIDLKLRELMHELPFAVLENLTPENPTSDED